jgi:hypothetical protein
MVIFLPFMSRNLSAFAMSCAMLRGPAREMPTLSEMSLQIFLVNRKYISHLLPSRMHHLTLLQ